MTPLIVVVSYRSDEHLDACLAGVDGAGDVVVVDNEPSDAAREIAALHSATYVRAERNLGFAAAVNLALQKRWDGNRDVLLLNPDARIQRQGVLTLQQALQADARLAAVGPLLTDKSGRPENADWPLPSPLQVWADAIGVASKVRWKRFVGGACLMLKAEALRDLGTLDERYFLYAEEADWQKRALLAGWRVAVVDTVRALHAGGASSSDSSIRERLFNASGERFIRKWYGTPGWILVRLGSVVAALRRMMTGDAVTRATARRTLATLVRGPERGLPDFAQTAKSSQPVVTHVVRSDSFAGVERYISDVATELVRRGSLVRVIGGDPERMSSAVPASVRYLPARTTAQVALALLRIGHSDVVHAHMTAAEFPTACLGHFAGDRLIATRHFASPRARTMTGRVARAVISHRFDTVIAISRFVAESVPERTTVVLNGVSAPATQERERERTVVLLQRLEPEKDTRTALRAWAQTSLAEEGWRMVIYGRGSEADGLAKFASDLGIAESVHFAGFADDPAEVFARAGIVVATAPAEPFGLAVVEAMAQGAVIVAARGGAHIESLGTCGLYFAPGSSDELAQQLDRLASDPSLRSNLGISAQQRQRTEFSIERHVDQLEILYGTK